MTISIQASVGLHGDNQPDDVLVVKSRLLELGFPFVTADSVMGPLTIKAIRLFQAVKNGLNDVDDQRNELASRTRSIRIIRLHSRTLESSSLTLWLKTAIRRSSRTSRSAS